MAPARSRPKPAGPAPAAARPGPAPAGNQRRRPPPPSRWQARADRRRRLLTRAALGLAGLAVVAGGIWAVRTFVTRDGDPGPPAAVLPGYRITYDVLDLTNGAPANRREVAVRRPLLVRDETFAPDGRRINATIVTTDHAYVQEQDKLVDLGQPAPSVSTPDFQFAAALPALRQEGLAEARGDASFAGRPCRIFRIGGPLGQRYTKATDADHADICVDAAGLVLQEDWVVGGHPARRTTATAASAAPPPLDAFTISPAEAVEKLPLTAAGQVTVTMPTDQPPVGASRYWSVDDPPWGFALTARAQTSRLRAVGQSLTPGPGSLIDLYTDKSAVILLSQQAADSVPTDDTVAGRQVRVSGLGRGTAAISPTGPQVRFTVDGVGLVVQGNVDIEHLTAFAHHIRQHRRKA